MSPSEISDQKLLDLMRERGAMSIAELTGAIKVTATAVRQRLTRLMNQGLIQREVQRVSRGRPSHRYTLTEKARRQGGGNFADLALVLWEEVRAIRDPQVRRGLFERLAAAMAGLYGKEVTGPTRKARLEGLQRLFDDRQVPMRVEAAAQGAKLTVLGCPYPDLAERDRGVCAMERMMFAKLLDAPLRLSACRLDGHSCCEFETSGVETSRFETQGFETN